MKNIYSYLAFTSCLILGILTMSSQQSNAQTAAFDFSTYLFSPASGTWSPGTEVLDAEVENGYMYYLIYSLDPDFQTTDGSSGTTNQHNVMAVKVDSVGTLIYSKVLASFISSPDIGKLTIQNGVMYAVVGNWYNASNTFISTRSSIGNLGSRDLYVFNLLSDGSTGYAVMVGGTGNDDIYPNSELHVLSGGNLGFLFTTRSNNLSVTDASTYASGDDMAHIIVSSTGGLVHSSYIVSGNSGENRGAIYYNADGSYYTVIRTNSSNLTHTLGSGYNGGSDHYIAKFSSSHQLQWARYMGGSADEVNPIVEVYNGDIYVYSTSKSSNFPTTDGSSRLDWGSNGDYVLYKINSSGIVIFSKILGGGGFEKSRQLVVNSGGIYVVGETQSSDIATTDGSTYTSQKDWYVASFNLSGSTNYITLIGGSGSDFLHNDHDFLHVQNGYVLLGGETYSSNLPVTNGTFMWASRSNYMALLDPNGQIVAASYVGGTGGTWGDAITHIEGTQIYMTAGYGTSDNYVVTDSSTASSGTLTDVMYTRFDLCPDGYFTDYDTLSPSFQSVCANGFISEIVGEQLLIPSDSLPALLYGSDFYQQYAIEAHYQWQISTSATGPWSNIDGATQKNYSPQPTTFTTYFRRVSTKGGFCNDEIVSISNVDTISVNSNTAPIVDGGETQHSCVNLTDSFTLGGSPTAIGGTGPYTYHWDNISTADSTLANPKVSPSSSTVYTVTVTDANGCQQLDQAVIRRHSIDAGPPKRTCNSGDTVQMEGSMIQGLPGVTYNWSVTTNTIIDSTKAKALIIPTAFEWVHYSAVIPKSSGGTCTVTDSTWVSYINPPTMGFAGDDTTICHSSTITLGKPWQCCYNYKWSPSLYLSDDESNQPTFDASGQHFRQVVDPIRYTVTMNSSECYWVDTVVVTVINADAGNDVCGPAYIGNEYKTDHPNLNETFKWTRISGTATILGDSLQPTALVSATSGGNSVFEITSMLNGQTCSDQVTVQDCGCDIAFVVLSRGGCPNNNNNPVKIKVVSEIYGNSFNYSWSPKVGLDVYEGDLVTLTDSTARWYTVTATHKLDTNLKCVDSIAVNQSTMLPVTFTALDTAVCGTQTLSIGQSSVASYTYSWWSEDDPTMTSTLANPSVTCSTSTTYYVKVEDVITGCSTIDTATIIVQNPVIDAGDDWVICSAATLQLGTPAVADHTYQWSPSSANYQNGTDSLDAQPEVLVAIDMYFSLIVTDTITGCIAYDTVYIDVNNTPDMPNPPDVSVCVGDTVTIGMPAMNGVTYSWSPSTDLSDASSPQPLLTATTTRTYIVTGIFPPGGCNDKDTVTVTVNSNTFSLTDTSFCPSSGSLTLSNGSPDNMAEYSWEPVSLFQDETVQYPSTVNPFPKPAKNATLTLTTVDTNGCVGEASMTLTPTVDPPITGNSQQVCLGESILIGSTSNPTGGDIVYSWSPSFDLSSSNTPTSIFTPSWTGEYSYTLTATDTVKGCSNSKTVNFKVNETPTAPVLSSTPICSGGTTTIGVTQEANMSYQWYPSSGLSNPNASSTEVTISNTQTYTLTMTNLYGCAASNNITVVVDTTKSPLVSLPDTSACQGSGSLVMDLSVTPTGDYDFLWTPNNGSLSSLTDSTPTVYIGNAGTYTYSVTVTDTLGCSTTEQMSLVVDPCVPVPVHWLDFRGSFNGKEVDLDWSVTNEMSNSHFEVYKLEGDQWVFLGKVMSKGEGFFNITTYQFVDVKPDNGMNYYRLKQVDFNGQFEWSKVVAINAPVERNGALSIYPNPARTELNIEIDGLADQIQLIDGMGRTVMSINSLEQDKITLDISTLNKGYYIVLVSHVNGKYSKARLIIQD